MQQWKLCDSFEVDDGSLEGVDPARCFVLGAEWNDFRRKLATAKTFTTLIHIENTQRLVRLCERHGRFVEHSNSGTAGWARITVGGHTD
jgi:hypothetical protein